eukprot:CAMPEP_0115314940 /NCGR_PEP_ID=MMETSP0270-20121206/77312_1 /TAXON_ID=71861 /ORGANISM="Scrippsiella trochoidea, Strain CCMP3099" /LENGTH=69 /DNA_ID=CAMNT_0002734223 /DNA_START=77 /DNA_END=283 /DNA_ORIENTATION=+
MQATIVTSADRQRLGLPDLHGSLPPQATGASASSGAGMTWTACCSGSGVVAWSIEAVSPYSSFEVGAAQ